MLDSNTLSSNNSSFVIQEERERIERADAYVKREAEFINKRIEPADLEESIIKVGLINTSENMQPKTLLGT